MSLGIDKFICVHILLTSDDLYWRYGEPGRLLSCVNRNNHSTHAAHNLVVKHQGLSLRSYHAISTDFSRQSRTLSANHDKRAPYLTRLSRSACLLHQGLCHYRRGLLDAGH